MARTLSDTLIIAMVEAATRLSGGRGPIGSAAAGAGPAGATQGAPAGQQSEAGTGVTVTATPPSGGGQGGAPAAGEHDSRTADQIAADFRTIYAQIEEVVRVSAEQETKTVGFGAR